MYGTLDVFSTLNAQAGSLPVFQFGEDRVFETIAEGLRIHNNIMQDMRRDLLEDTTDYIRRYGGEAEGEMEEIDEYGMADAQKHITGTNIGFPLKNYEYALQWTRTFLLNALVGELVKEIQAARRADVRRMTREIQRAVFNPTNNLTYIDRRVRRLVLPIRAFLNGDGTDIPPNPFNGDAFDSATHSHFLSFEDFTPTALEALIEKIVEHGVVGEVRVYIAGNLETTLRDKTIFPDFAPLVDARIVQPFVQFGESQNIARGSLETVNIYNREIGLYGPARIFVKHWVFSNYAFAFDSGVQPLVYRTRPNAAGITPAPGNLQVVYENENFPLRAQQMQREFGISVYRREKGAVLFVNGNDDTDPYEAPTIP